MGFCNRLDTGVSLPSAGGKELIHSAAGCAPGVGV